MLSWIALGCGLLTLALVLFGSKDGKEEGAVPTDDQRPAARAAADRKFRELRAGGYRGAIDQDGNAVEDVDAWIADRLRRADDAR